MDNKKIFSTDFNMTWDEYRKMMILTPEFYWWNVFKTSIVEIIIILFISVIYKLNITTAVIIGVITICFVMILYKVKIEWLIKKHYNYYKKNRMISDKVTITFFDNYLIKKSDNIEIKLNYDQVKKIIETENNFYIYGNNAAVIINKEECKEKEEEFLRNINSKIYYKKNKLKKNKEEVNAKDNTFLLNLLFYITIFSFFGAVLTIRAIAKEVPSSLITEKMWVFWLWLPVPILSIIIGYKLKNQNKKAKSNIIFGCVICVLLIVFGSFCVVMPIGRIPYNKIKPYEEILKINIPRDGDYIQQKYRTYFDLDKKNVTVTEAFFQNSLKLKKFEQNIVNGQNWINFKTISNELEPLIPYQMIHRECKKCYITIYNEKTQEYNTVTRIKENYKMHVALYDLEQHQLEINTYEFE